MPPAFLAITMVCLAVAGLAILVGRRRTGTDRPPSSQWRSFGCGIALFVLVVLATAILVVKFFAYV